MGTNYGRGIIRQVEELTLQNERLVVENKRLLAENKEYRAQIEALTAAMEEVRAKFTAEIERLKAQINKNSGNSSKPPSQDGFKRVQNSREPSGRKSGGQSGHLGKRLELPKNLDELIEKGVARRELVDHTGGADSYRTRYTLDVDVTLVVTEHRYPRGATPLGAEVTYGEKMKALTVLLSTEGIIAEERLSDFFSEITHGAIRLSDATIESFLTDLSRKLDPELEAIKTSLLNEEAMHVDETPVRCTEKPDYSDGEKAVLRKASGTSFSVYIRTHSSENATLYTVNPQKDKDGADRDGIFPRFFGILSHDHEAKFYHYGIAHATCGAHLLRELRGLFELQKIPWADEMRRFVAGINARKNADLAKNATSCDPDSLCAFEREYDRLLEQGRIALSLLKENELGFDELRRMLNRLSDYKDCYLLFIRDYRAPFTNNQAERDLRPCKTRQKVSGCFRSWDGILRYTNIRSFLSTLKKRNHGLLLSISRALSGLPVLPVAE
jgi:transposase